ncbi:MAG: hypothetical protein H6598_01380 [Flavobacteriales bacterium]|nr:hypothetical protein [Flavobacteriales bacterium]
MKKMITLLKLSLSIVALSFILNSCAVFIAEKDHGKHNGWYKNTNNPHHPKSTNPGHQKKYKKEK